MSDSIYVGPYLVIPPVKLDVHEYIITCPNTGCEKHMQRRRGGDTIKFCGTCGSKLDSFVENKNEPVGLMYAIDRELVHGIDPETFIFPDHVFRSETDNVEQNTDVYMPNLYKVHGWSKNFDEITSYTIQKQLSEFLKIYEKEISEISINFNDDLKVKWGVIPWYL